MADLSNLIDKSLLQLFGELTIVPINGAIKALAGAVDAMADAEIPSASGAHGFRYYQNNLQYSTEAFQAVTPTGIENPSEVGWFELDGETYVLSSDTSVAADKTYYKRIVTWHTIETGGGADPDLAERVGVCEQNILAIIFAMTVDQQAEITGTSGNIVIEDFSANSGFIVASGLYDSTNHRIWA